MSTILATSLKTMQIRAGKQTATNMKPATVVVILMLSIACCDGEAALRRKPKVYNALITTDEDLVQSRAYPVIQPTIHESGIAHYPFSPYGVYNQHVARLAQPIAPALTPKQQLPYALPPPQIQPQLMQQSLISQPLSGYPLPQSPPSAPESEKINEPSLPPTGLEERSQPTIQPPAMLMPTVSPELSKDPNQPNKMPLQQLPIPLNRFGLPPALIPLRQPQPYPPQPYPLPNGRQPYNLPPYRFNPIPPVYYNSFPGVSQQFLPPYGYLPTGPQFPLSNTIPTDKMFPQLPSPPQPANPPQLPSPPQPPSPAQSIPAAAPPNPPAAPPATPPTPPAAPPTPPASPPTPPPSPPLTAPPESNDSAVPSTNPSATEPPFENIKNGSKSKDSNVPDVPPPPIPSGASSKQS